MGLGIGAIPNPENEIGGTQFKVTIISGVNEIIGILGIFNNANCIKASAYPKKERALGIPGSGGSPKHLTDDAKANAVIAAVGIAGIFGIAGSGNAGIEGNGN